MIVVGIDNGLDGGLVALDGLRVIGRLTMPTIDLPSGKRDYDIPTIVMALESWMPGRVFLERAQAMPGQGVTSMFSIGKGFGIQLGILSALKIPFSVVQPKAWQKMMFSELPKMDTKEASRIVCLRRWPDVDWRASPRCRIAHDGLTDAACIAEYGYRAMKGIE